MSADFTAGYCFGLLVAWLYRKATRKGGVASGEQPTRVSPTGAASLGVMARIVEWIRRPLQW